MGGHESSVLRAISRSLIFPANCCHGQNEFIQVNPYAKEGQVSLKMRSPPLQVSQE
ncbi:hypothetical protein Nmel_018018 [Mimus melanotis]